MGLTSLIIASLIVTLFAGPPSLILLSTYDPHAIDVLHVAAHDILLGYFIAVIILMGVVLIGKTRLGMMKRLLQNIAVIMGLVGSVQYLAVMLVFPPPPWYLYGG